MATTSRPNRKPSLALTTPVTACFPADALKSAASVRSPLSAQIWKPIDPAQASAGLPSAGLPSAGLYSPAIAHIKAEDALIKTPISPPIAYMDFLRLASPAFPAFPASPGAAGMGMTSPPLTGKRLVRTSTAASLASTNSSATNSSAEDSDNAADVVGKEIDSAPSTSTSEVTDCSCDCEGHEELVHKSPKASTAGIIPPSPFAAIPMSAPPTGATSFPSLKVPTSPVVGSPVMSPFSARSVRSPFDWEAALKARKAAGAPRAAAAAKPAAPSAPAAGHSCGKGKTAVRHIREVVTRTVTYTPRMEPAPKGKRRKVE